MKYNWRFLVTPVIGAMVALSGCSANNNKNDVNNHDANKNKVGVRSNDAGAPRDLDYHNKKITTKGNTHVHGNDNSVNVIPSIDRTKKRTTNHKGTTTSGLGTNVYSLIGSSSLHDGGISSHLESRLSAAGIPGIKVFVLDDTVILARASQEITSTKYDELQNKVLKNTSGQSGKGTQDGVDYQKLKTNNNDNLENAKQLINKSFGGQVQVLTVTNPKAMTLIDRIKGTLKSAKPSYSQLSSDINTLIQMTKEK